MDDADADRVRRHFRKYTDHQLFGALVVLADARNSAPTPEAAERHQNWLLLAADERDERYADRRTFYDLVCPVAVIEHDLDPGGPTS